MERFPVLSLESSEIETPPRSFFEEGLFADGAYIYDAEKEITVAEGEVVRRRKKVAYEERLVAKGTFRREIVDYQGVDEEIFCQRWDLTWREHFSGLIPEKWGAKWNSNNHAIRDFGRAGESGVQLSPALVYAGLLHHSKHVLMSVAESQLLDEEQLSICFLRIAFSPLPYGSTLRSNMAAKAEMRMILEAQRGKGVSEEQIAKAKESAQERAKRWRGAMFCRGDYRNYE